MALSTGLAWVAGATLLVFGLGMVARGDRRMAGAWRLPAAVSVAFFLFSLVAILTEGPTGFWREHTQHLWGNQIWFDLLLAASVGWTVALPRARAVGMNLVPWFLAIVGTGSIAFLAFLARLLYLEGGRKP